MLGEGFHEESDIDLMVEGLPPQDLLGAIKLAETDACRSVDLKRAEDISAELRFRHLVRNLYADELRPEPIALLLGQLPPLWHLIAQHG